MVHHHFGNGYIPSRIAGLGVGAPPTVATGALRRRLGLTGPYLLYLGRIVQSKGIDELLTHFQYYRSRYPEGATLLLLGKSEMELPTVPGLRFGGFVSEEEKWEALAEATAVVVPSRLESLSIITLEAWASGRPVLAPIDSPVLRGLLRRSGGGLPYTDSATFAEALNLLLESPETATALGEAGRRYGRERYSPAAVDGQYRWAIEQVTRESWT